MSFNLLTGLCRDYAFGTTCAYAVTHQSPPPFKSQPTRKGAFPVTSPDQQKELDDFEKAFLKQCKESAPPGKMRGGTCKNVRSKFVCVCCEKCSN